MSLVCKTLDDWLDLWEELHETGAVSDANEFLAKYVPENALAAEERNHLRGDIETLIACDRKIDKLLPKEETTYATTSFLSGQDRGGEPGARFFRRLAAGVEIISGYTLKRRLGRGGFGEVWLASGPGGFAAAMKFIPRAGRGNAVERASLDVIREIHHPNLIPIYGAWETDDFLVIAMAPADETLMDRYQSAAAQNRTGLAAEELLEPFRDIAKTLDYLNGCPRSADAQAETNHSPTIHGDVKPQNILLSGGSVWLGDLGLARVLAADGPTKHSGNLTAAFAAPESLEGLITQFSDQYALASTWHFLRTGRIPLGGADDLLSKRTAKSAARFGKQILIRSQRTQDSAHQTPPSQLPANERHVLARALAKTPSDRYPSCGAWIAALARAVRRDRFRTSVRRVVQAISAALAVLLAASLFWLLFLYLPDRIVNRDNRIGQREAALGHWEEAFAAFSRTLSRHPESSDAREGRAAALVELGRINEAARDLDHLDSDHGPCAESQFLRGVIFARREQPEAAIQAFSAAIDLAPKQSKYLTARAAQYLTLEQNAPALDDLNRAIALDPANAEALALRGGIVEDYNAALADLTQAIRLAPHQSDFFFQRALLFMKWEEDVLALADTEAVLRLDPNRIETYILRAEIYERLGQNEKKEQEMKKALECSESVDY